MSGLPKRHCPPTACKRVVSGTISLPSQGFFSPFPHGTGSLSVASEYLALPDGPGRFPQGSTCPAVLRSHLKKDCIFTYGAVTLYGRPFQTVLLTLSYPSFNQVNARLRGVTWAAAGFPRSLPFLRRPRFPAIASRTCVSRSSCRARGLRGKSNGHKALRRGKDRG